MYFLLPKLRRPNLVHFWEQEFWETKQENAQNKQEFSRNILQTPSEILEDQHLDFGQFRSSAIFRGFTERRPIFESTFLGSPKTNEDQFGAH